MWFLFALASAIFAALTSVLAKMGIEGINSDLATAIRTSVVLVMAWGIVFIINAQSSISSLDKKSWIFLILSGLCTGASWLFYYKSIQIGQVSKVVAIDKLSIVITIIFSVVLLNEKFSIKSILGAILIVFGSLFMVL